MIIRHVVNVVGQSARADLLDAQELTLQSIERALRITSTGTEVQVVGARFTDEGLPRDWLLEAPPLERSVLDLGNFEPPRRLPLLCDILRAFDEDDFDLGVFTNIDIAVQPHFYDLIAELNAAGYDAFTINRRTVQPSNAGNGLASLAAQTGAPHPGHDCFVFDRKVASAIDVGEVCVGVPLVARALLFNITLAARRFRQFIDLNATFHVGDDRQWASPTFDSYSDHNYRSLLSVMRNLVETYGEAAVTRVPDAPRFLRWARKSEPPVWRPVRPDPRRPIAQKSLDRRRLIFSASPGRSGSEFLARLLATAPGVVSHHEAEPTMTGRHLRSVAYGSLESSYTARVEKADSLDAELRSLPAGGVLVETSHMFVKTFADVVLDRFNHDMITVVQLQRSLADLVASMLALGWFTPLAPAWPDWLIPPTAPGSRFPVDAELIEGRIDLAIGYVLDTEIRSRELRAAHPNVSWVDLNVADVRSEDRVHALFRALHLEPTSATWDVAFSRVNERSDRKRKRRVAIAPATVSAGIRSFAARFSDRVAAHGLEFLFEE